MTLSFVTAEVIKRPGNWGDDTYSAIEVRIDGVKSPFHMVMALSRVSAKAAAEQVDVDELYDILANAINCCAKNINVREAKP